MLWSTEQRVNIILQIPVCDSLVGKILSKIVIDETELSVIIPIKCDAFSYHYDVKNRLFTVRHL